MTLLRHDLGDGVDLVLKDRSTVDEVHALVVRNIERLKLWETWAHSEQTVETTRAYTEHRMHAFATGTAIPLAIRVDGRIVGTIEGRIDAVEQTAEIGYWVDFASEGRGIMTRAGRALVDHLHGELGLHRVQATTSGHNARSRALAERLGFELEGVLRSAHPVGTERHDLALYASVR